MNYRADIDGLRAIAVLLVVLYHAGFTQISAGFIGVDVFFVISGFLITSILLPEIRTQKLSFTAFFLKRAKRILPVFYFVSIVTVFLGYILLLPEDFLNLVESFVSASFFGANFFFWTQSSGYFQSSTAQMPLLHTWSLSLEEQFYFLWPITLVLFHRYFRSIQIICVLLISVVFLVIFSEWAAINKSNGAYFLLPTRAWELLIGATLGLAMYKKQLTITHRFSNVFSVLGLSLIFFAALTFDKLTTFPGLNALFPCLGAALIIYSGQNKSSFMTKALSLKVFTHIGLLSYSLYLWHWPIIAYLNYLNVEFTLSVKISVVLSSVILSYFSWKYVEQFFRKIKVNEVKGVSFYFLLPCLISSLFLLFVTSKGGDLKELHLVQGYSEAREKVRMPMFDDGWCYKLEEDILNENYQTNNLDCYLGMPESQKFSMFFGDSHAAHFQPLIQKLMIESNSRSYTYITSNCFPSLNYINSKNFGGNPKLCKRFRQMIKNRLDSSELDNVYIAAKWDSNLKWLSETDEAIAYMSTRVNHIYILPQVPSYKSNIGKNHLKSFASSLYRKQYVYPLNEKYKNANHMVSQLAEKYSNVTFIALDRFFQGGEIFDSVGFPLYYDDDHLNIYGSEKLADFVVAEGLDSLAYH
jgi:peptidoglycan/LPS O-acetylase OafA/YrhL